MKGNTMKYLDKFLRRTIDFLEPYAFQKPNETLVPSIILTREETIKEEWQQEIFGWAYGIPDTDHRQVILATILNNVFCYYNPPPSYTSSKQHLIPRKMLAKMNLNVMKNFGLYDIIGVQAFRQPLDYIHTVSFDNDTKMATPLKKIMEIETSDLDAVSVSTIDDENIELVSGYLQSKIEQDLVQLFKDNCYVGDELYDHRKVSGTACFVGDESQSITNYIISQFADFKYTGNKFQKWAIISEKIHRYLMTSTSSAYARNYYQQENDNTTVYLAGSLNSTIAIFVNRNAAEDDLILGWNGKNNIDVPLIYVPYMPVWYVVNDETKIKFKTRGGVYMNDMKHYVKYIKLSITF